MKKSLFRGLISALALVVSCTIEPKDPSLYKKELVLTAVAEQPVGSRTVIESDARVFWEPGDEITVFCGNGSGKFVSDLSAPAATASFRGSLEGVTSGSELWGVYPASEETAFDGGAVSAVLPSRQVARAGSFAQGMNLSVARSTDRTLQFYNVGGGVRFSVTEEGIKKVVFESLGNEFLAGKVKIGFEDGRPRVLEVSEGSRYVTLIPPDGGTFETGKWYYIVAIPGALEQGYRLKFYKDEVYAQRVSEAAVTIKRSIYGSLENADAGLSYEPIPNLTEWTTEKTMRGVQYEEQVGGEGGDGATTGEIVQMPPEALFVMDDLNELLQSFDDKNWTITYKDGPALTEADIKVGDVLYSMPVGDIAPEGYILRVTGVRKEGDRVVYDVEPAGLADAFEHLSTYVPIDVDHLSEDCITVYDILEQPDQSWQIADFDANVNTSLPISTRSVFDEWKIDVSAVTDTNKLKIKVESDKASISYVLVDGDNNPKTTYDQIRLVVRLDYEFTKECLHFDFDASKLFLSLDFTPSLGASCGFQYGFKGTSDQVFDFLDIGDETPKVWDAGTLRQLDEMEKKLMGKKIRILSYDLTKHGFIPKAVKAVVRPTIELYAYFKLSLEGNLEVSFGLEKTPWNLHAENIPYTTMPNMLRMIPKPDHLTPTFKFTASMDFKGSTGLGVGVVAALPKIAEKISYKDPNSKEIQVPYMGFFFEWGLNAKAKSKNWVDIVSGNLHTDLSVDVYNELSGYLEAYAHLKSGMLFNPKVDLIKLRIPEESVYKYERSWETEQRYPIPVLISPSNRAATEGNSVSLQWKIPTPDKAFLPTNEQFRDLQFSVYAGTDKEAVNSLKETCLIAIKKEANDTTRYDMKSCDFSTENMKTYWWKVVCENGKGETYESPLGTFDCGYDGKLVFDLDLSRWLSDHFEALGDVYIQDDGSILRTASNIKALAELKTLEIMDGGTHYHIKSIDELLQNIPSLETLDCRNNTLTSLDISRNPKLKSLICNENQISALDFSNNKLLTNISCKNNKLTSLNVTGLSSLENVSCSDNAELETLVFSGCPVLTSVSCPNCRISTLDLSDNQNLRDLYASENYLDSLDISRCPNLIRLDVYAQHKERLKLRLMRRQYEGFALFKRHVNMDFEFAENVMTGDPVRLTQTSATIPVAYRVEGDVLQCGVVYSIDEKELKISTAPVEYGHGWEAGTYSVTLEGLLPDTEYRARGFVLASGESSICYGNVIRFKTLPGDGVPVMSVSPQYIEFGEVEIGESLTKPFRIFNKGDGPLVFHLEGDSPFSWSPEGEITIPAYGDEEVFVTFTPDQAREWEDVIRIVSNASKEAFEFQVNGIGIGEAPFSVKAIDLGLPSGIQWANANVGAQSKTDIGSLFAWGETETKDKYLQSNYAWYDGGYTKYCFEPGNGANGFTDQKGVLELEDDAARAQWKEPWRTPSREEWQELIDHCDWAADTLQGVPCVRGTSKTTGNSIWFPVSERTYWSSSLYGGKNTTDYDTRINSLCVYALSFSVKRTGVVRTDLSYDTHWRYNGYPVRPVKGIVNEIRLDRQSLSLQEGSLATLRASVYPASAPNQAVRWNSSDESVAFVSSEGIVYGLHPGTVTVTAYSVEGNVPASCEVTVLPGVVHDPVDLGLSVKWASRDIGTTQAWAYGVPYRWAETVPYQEGTAYRWARDKMWTKYNEYDKRTVLELSDDAAAQAWGDHWRTPSREEWQELLDNCTQTYLKIGSIEIVQLVSKKNGGAICFVLPFSSVWPYWTSNIKELGKKSVPGCFSSLHGGSRPYFDEDSPLSDAGLVRAVYDEVFHFPVTGISLNRTALKMTEGGSSSSLDARVWPNNASDLRFTWSSSDPSIVSVSAEGLLKALRPGTATITVQTTEGGFRAQCQVTVGPAPQAVDMGLSVLWASCDVGADAPEEGGIEFRWGETAEPEPDQPDWIYQWFLEDNYTTPGKMLMGPSQDPATVCLGGGWRTPTRAEWEELTDRQNCAWTIQNGCCVITSKKTGNSIRIPVGDHRTNELSESGVSWTYSLNTRCEFLRWMCSFAIAVRAVISASDLNPGGGNEGVTTGDDIPM